VKILQPVLVGLVLTTSTAWAEELVRVSDSRYNPFVSAMEMMMGAMDSYSRKRAWEDALSGGTWQTQPWSQGATNMPGMASQIPGRQQMQQMMQIMPQSSRYWGDRATQMLSPQRAPGTSTGMLDGAWQGRSGEVLIVRNGLFRLYAGLDQYQDGRIALRGSQAIMTDPASGRSRSYEYAIDQGRLAFRDDQGNLLLYRKLPDSTIRALLSSH
jgi:hypothetical protein